MDTYKELVQADLTAIKFTVIIRPKFIVISEKLTYQMRKSSKRGNLVAISCEHNLDKYYKEIEYNSPNQVYIYQNRSTL